MPRHDDWQFDLIPRRIQLTKEAQAELDNLIEQLSRGKEIFNGIMDYLKDCAHQGKAIYGSVYLAQANIPNSNQRISCQYTFDGNTVYVSDIWMEEIS